MTPTSPSCSGTGSGSKGELTKLPDDPGLAIVGSYYVELGEVAAWTDADADE
jgi:hypothetical protein